MGKAKAWLVVLAPLTATIIAVTRTMDYRHHWEDVLVGSLLGLTISYFSYLQFFPALAHPESFMPLSRFREPIQINEEGERERLFVDEEAGLPTEGR
ncbi:hypothetical protein Clacol_000570 [Clathrus columnatus]|uniref:Phosphatidic acid phosphatase type 2/haloperoxidase domain-containing protein n=1 Tax=Clathrus columnatus TaxID=1419009 RepID=A0AAV4ZZE1_9AGAM|nr:hypothetical protein Clacol_000570 [Clathrus columnatus]